MNLDSTIFVAGHTGLVGSALMRALSSYRDVVTAAHSSLDLTDLPSVLDFFHNKKPEYVFLAAARVGGILDNDSFPVNFLDENCRIQLNVMQAAARFGVKRLIFLGSSCIYPKMCKQPIREEYILSGKLEPTNDAYAIAKLSGIVGCRSYNRQFGTEFIVAMPTNLYGPNDNFDLNSGHVLPALIRKVHEAHLWGAPNLVLWGTGSPKREFLYVDDLAEALICAIDKYTLKSNNIEDISINIGTGKDLSIKELAATIADVVGYRGNIEWDVNKPDGTPRKLLCVDRIKSLGWEPKTSLTVGIEKTYAWFLENLGQ